MFEGVTKGYDQLGQNLRAATDYALEKVGVNQDDKLLKEICDYFENNSYFNKSITVEGENQENVKDYCKKLAIACYFESHRVGVGFSSDQVSHKFLQKLTNEFSDLKLQDNFISRLTPGSAGAFIDSGQKLNKDVAMRVLSAGSTFTQITDEQYNKLKGQVYDDSAQEEGVKSWSERIKSYKLLIEHNLPNRLRAGQEFSLSPAVTPRPGASTSISAEYLDLLELDTSEDYNKYTIMTKLPEDFKSKTYEAQFNDLKKIFFSNNQVLKDFKDLRPLYQRQYEAQFSHRIQQIQIDDNKKDWLKKFVEFAFFASSLITAKKGEHNSTKTQAFFGANSAQAVIEYAKSIKDEDNFEKKISTFTKFACTEARFYDPSVIVSAYNKATKDGQQIDYSGGQQDEFNFYKCKENDKRVDQILNLFQLQNPPSIDPIKTKQSDHLKKYITNYGAFGEIHKNKDLDILQLSDSSSINKVQKRVFLLLSAIHHELEKLTFSDAALQSNNYDLPILAHIKDAFFKDNPDEYKKFLQNDAYDFLVKLQKDKKSPFNKVKKLRSINDASARLSNICATKHSNPEDEVMEPSPIENLLYSVDELDDTKKKYLEKQALQIPFIQTLVASEDYKKRSIDRGKISDLAESYRSFYNSNSELFYSVSSDSDYLEFVNKKEGLRSFLVSLNYKGVDLVKFGDDKIGCEIDSSSIRYQNLTGDKSGNRVVNLYSFSRYDEEGRLKSDRKVFLNEKACKEVHKFLTDVEKIFLNINGSLSGDKFTPEDFAMIAYYRVLKSKKTFTLDNFISEIKRFETQEGKISEDEKNLFFNKSKHHRNDKTNAEQILDYLLQNGLMIDGSASIIREYSYPEEQKTTSFLSRLCSPKSNNVKHTYVRTESCGFEGEINVQLHASKQVKLKVEKDGKVTMTKGFENLPTLRHKAHILKEDDKIETTATKFKKNQFANVSSHSIIKKKTSSIEQQGYGFYFEKTTTSGQDFYELKFSSDNKFGVWKVIPDHRFSKKEFDKFVREYTGEWMPAKFSIQDQSKDNISTAIRRFISKEKHGICKLIAGEKYFDIPVYQDNQKIDEILSVKNDGDRSLWILPRFGSRSKSGGLASRTGEDKGSGR
jgi:hypothetical protein